MAAILIPLGVASVARAPSTSVARAPSTSVARAPSASVASVKPARVRHMISGLPFSAPHPAQGLRLGDPDQAWCLEHSVGSQQRLSTMAALLLPPRKVECPSEAIGTPARGRCVPASILLQLERAGQRKTRRGPSDAAADEMRLRVISFAERCMHAPWDPSDPSEATLGQVIAAASCRSYFLRGKQGPWKADFESWARRHRHRPQEGCDCGWLWAAAACYGLAIHTYSAPSRDLLVKHHVFEAPASACRAGAALRRATLGVHLGFVEGDNSGVHAVSMPSLLGRREVYK